MCNMLTEIYVREKIKKRKDGLLEFYKEVAEALLDATAVASLGSYFTCHFNNCPVSVIKSRRSLVLVFNILHFDFSFSSLPSLLSRFIFSSPEPKARVSYCHSAPSVRRRRPSVNFSHFRLLLQNRLMDFDETW